MFTVMSAGQKKQQLDEFNEVTKLDGVEIIVTPHVRLNMLFAVFFIFMNILRHKKVSMIAKKVDLRPLVLVKKVFKQRFRYFIEVEGDAYSECIYLQQHPYKDGFYDRYLKSAKANIDGFAGEAKSADGLLVLSEAFKNVLLERHSFLTEDKIQVTSTGFVKDRFIFNAQNRLSIRNKLGIVDEPVFVYAGNVYYSWQNIKQTLRFFYFYLKNINESSKFIILTHSSDQGIVTEFISEIGIPPNSIIIKEVPNSEIVDYYNAADICLLLRENHLMCRLASPGKIGEYAASGTPILTSSYIGDYSTLLTGQELVAQIDNISDFECMVNQVKKLLKVTEEEKLAFSRWSNKRLSSQSNIKSFIKTFEM